MARREAKVKPTKKSRKKVVLGVRAVREHEQSFCADVKSWLDRLFEGRPDLPFAEAKVEQYARGSWKRQDLRIHDTQGRIALTGEVKLPGTPEGRSAYEESLVEDARQKADNIGAHFFFTWNVKELVLWDRQKCDVPAHERRAGRWPLGIPVENREELVLPEVRKHIRDIFLPRFFSEFADIYLGRTEDWGMPPDDFFIWALNSHLDWPVIITRDWLADESERSRSFSAALEDWMARDQQWTFTRGDAKEWRTVLERAARTLCYVLSNRMIFYEAVRKRFPKELDRLTIRRRVKDPRSVYLHLSKQFQEAVGLTGDYETIFPPPEEDKVGAYVFRAPGAVDAWEAVVGSLDAFNLRTIPHDIVGGIFQKLVSPEERHRFGQHFTHEDIVDVINAFCIRKADATVLDPACGSGSFLVRAYHRKAFLDPSKTHQQILGEIYGCDIALFAAHLATLNLAARNITNEENYPYVARRNFFEVERKKPFWQIPESHSVGGRKVKMKDVFLPELDAVVGNPPYVRQELIPKKGRRGAPEKQTKEHLQDLVSTAWQRLKLSGRSDLHLYFWPAATRFLKDSAEKHNADSGYFGFLTSSSWLDVEYGFALQQWVLKNFKIITIIESVDEPWFEDARVKTCVTVLQRCSDEKARDSNLVRFVRVLKPLDDVLGERPPGDENARQRAAEEFRETVLGHRDVHEFYRDGFVRISAKRQGELFAEGSERRNGQDVYAGGKWGRYLRAPDYYFDIMREFGDRFVRLGDIAEIRFGVKSGCDAFFMPHDVTKEYLEEYPDEKAWRKAPMLHSCTRRDVRSGKLKIVKAGDGSVHPIEAKYLQPEVHSPMHIDRPLVGAEDCPRVILLVSEPKSRLKGSFALKYIQYGERQTFQSGKSKSVPLPERSTCAARERWYDLGKPKPGFAFWPMAQQYRHIIAENPERLICNHRLFDVHSNQGGKEYEGALSAILNSTLIALWKQFYGRYTGTEGSLDTEVIDVELLQVPDPQHATTTARGKLRRAFGSLCKRPVLAMVEKEFMDCHSPKRARDLASRPIELPEELRQPDRRELDEAVFELLGVKSPIARRDNVNRLYKEVTLFFRQIRLVEIQKQEQRTKTKAKRFSVDDLAADIWDSLEAEEKKPLAEWLDEQPGKRKKLEIPEGPATLADETNMLDALVVYFGKRRDSHIECANRPLAELVAEVAGAGFSGPLALPTGESACRKTLQAYRARTAHLKARFEEMAASRTGTEKLQEGVVSTLTRWAIFGK